MTSITATARRWEHGWEIEIDADHHTQTATLDKAEQQVRDYLDTEDPGMSHDGWEITIIPELGSLGDQVIAARRATEDAISASIQAARRSREIVRRLRDSGYSVTDTAAILGISRGRVSQLTHG